MLATLSTPAKKNWWTPPAEWKNSGPACLKKPRQRQLRKRERQTRSNIIQIKSIRSIQIKCRLGLYFMDSVIIEIRPGAGGDEASLFAGDLFKMYKNYAAKKGFGLTVLDSALTAIGGLKEISFEVSGTGAYNIYKQEAGVHRVQRVPQTEKSGRVHTSTVSVAVLKKASEKDVQINSSDLRIEFFRSSGPGGQNVNKRETAVRIIHIPTGTVVTAQTERGQEANKQFALSILRSRILEETEKKENLKLQSERRTQIGSADRSEKIRTYNFPQDRITDHRIKKSWSQIDKVLDGNMDPIIKAFQKTKDK